MRINEVTYGKLKTPLKVNGNLKIYRKTGVHNNNSNNSNNNNDSNGLLRKINYSVESRFFNYTARKGTELRFRLRVYFLFFLESRCYAHAPPRAKNIRLSLGTKVEILLFGSIALQISRCE